MVKSLIQVQDAYINSYHPDFMGGANSIVNVFDVNTYKQQMMMKGDESNRSQKSIDRSFIQE